MKKNYALLLLSAAALTANAQQIDGDFDATWEDCIPYDSKGGTNAFGTQPQGWHVSNVFVNKYVAKCQIATSVTGSNGEGQAVKLTNGDLFTNGIPAYLTLGTPYATAEGLTATNPDGGTFGGKSFTYHPDAISFDYQRDNSKGDENAIVVAYLWNGTWSQANVPANTVLSGSANKITMEYRERNILNIPTATGGDVTTTEGATLVAVVNDTIKESTNNEWVNKTVEFKYNDASAKVENINVIFSANDYFADRTSIVKGNSLSVDNVKLVYYHALSSLTATDNDGNDVELDFNPETLNYTVNSTFDEYWTEVNYTKKGIGATVDAEYNAETAQYIITVKGEDYDENTNPNAVTVYTIQYQKAAPTLSSLIVAGHEFMSTGSTNTEFTATGKCYADEISYTASSENAKVEADYDEASQILTVNVSEQGAPSTVYTITFEGKQNNFFYQVPNSSFEDWTDNSDGSNAKLAKGWNSFDTACGLYSTFASMSPMPEKIDGYKGYGVRISSKDLWLAYANGNLTTGKISMGSYEPTDATNFNFTDRTDVNSNLRAAGLPDAFEVYARFTPGTLKNGVDANLQGRVQVIMHTDAPYHDPELPELADKKDASAFVLIPPTEEWTKFTGEFKYESNTIDADVDHYYLVSATTNPVPGASKDDKLDLDELRFIYYNTLADISFNGKTIEGFDPNKFEYAIDEDIEDAEYLFDIKPAGFGASTYTEINHETGIVTIYVAGNNIEEDPSNKNIYTVKFKKSTTGINTISADKAANHKVYTLNGVRVNGKPAAGIYIVDGKKMTVK